MFVSGNIHRVPIDGGKSQQLSTLWQVFRNQFSSPLSPVAFLQRFTICQIPSRPRILESAPPEARPSLRISHGVHQVNLYPQFSPATKRRERGSMCTGLGGWLFAGKCSARTPYGCCRRELRPRRLGGRHAAATLWHSINNNQRRWGPSNPL